MVTQNPLPAPQATLISALAQGVIGGSLDWKMIGIGALVGVGLILLDAAPGRHRPRAHSAAGRRYRHLSPDVGHLRGRGRRAGRHVVRPGGRASGNYARADRLGTLVASGLIVGESLFGVLNAGLIVAFSNDAPIALVGENFAGAPVLGVVGFVATIVALYLVARAARCPGAPLRRRGGVFRLR